MSLTTKEKKKLTHRLLNTDKKLNIIITDIVFQYFVVFWVALLADLIMSKLLLNYQLGINHIQGMVLFVCLVQMFRYRAMMEK